MTGRYEIQDILTQDASGVVFHAEDRESGKTVVLRRFFPYGPEGGGLQEAERSAYLAALERLRAVRHPTLRTVLDGGCDPVDGMPFLVTEWVEGQRLSELLKERPLSPASAKALVSHALEASQALSETFAEEGIWVETSPESVILPEAGGALTFWACPVRWLGDPRQRGGLLPLAQLAEKALHWRGKPVAGTAEGLGSWVKAVRENPDRWTLADAITALNEPETLHSLPIQQGGVPTVPMPAKGKVPAKAGKKSRSLVPVLLALLVGGGAVGGGYHFLKSRKGKDGAQAAASKEIEIPKGTSALDFASRGQVKPAPEAAATPEPRKKAAEQPAAPRAIVSGRVAETEDSRSEKTRYLKISVEGAKEPRWVGYRVSQNAKGLETADFEALKDKHIEVNGDEKKENSHRKIVVFIGSRDQIKVLD